MVRDPFALVLSGAIVFARLAVATGAPDRADALTACEPRPRSGRQEMYESLLNAHLLDSGRLRGPRPDPLRADPLRLDPHPHR